MLPKKADLDLCVHVTGQGDDQPQIDLCFLRRRGETAAVHGNVC